MEARWESIRPYRLSMDDFVDPDRRMDAFPSRRYEVPPVYVSDAVGIAYPADCDVTVRVESQTLFVEKGDVLFMAPYARHQSHLMAADGRICNVALRPARLREALPRLFMTPNPVGAFLEQCARPSGPLYLHLPAAGLEFDRAVFSEAAEFFIHHPDAGEGTLLLWESRLERALLTLLERPELKGLESALPGAGEDKLSRVLGCIQRNLERATLRQVADTLGWNASHLSRYIREKTGRSFTEIVQVLRLDEASTLLARTDCTVEEAMARTGYTGKANFYAIFRQRYGVTPARYRRMVRD